MTEKKEVPRYKVYTDPSDNFLHYNVCYNGGGAYDTDEHLTFTVTRWGARLVIRKDRKKRSRGKKERELVFEVPA